MFIGYQKDKIVIVANTREELENNKFMVFDKIEESQLDYVLYNGEYLPVEAAAARKAQEEKEAKIQDLQEQLDALDLKAVRALRAMSAGVGTQTDKNKLEELESQAASLRKQLEVLSL